MSLEKLGILILKLNKIKWNQLDNQLSRFLVWRTIVRDRYLRKFPTSERDGLRYGGYHRYDGYDIISERELKVNIEI